MTAPELLTPDEAAQRLRCKPGWLVRKAGRREIPHVLIAGAIRFRPEHLAEIVTANERPVENRREVIPARRRPTPPTSDAATVRALRARPDAARKTRPA